MIQERKQQRRNAYEARRESDEQFNEWIDTLQEPGEKS